VNAGNRQQPALRRFRRRQPWAPACNVLRWVSELTVEDCLHLLHRLDAGCCLHHFSIPVIHSVWQPHESAGKGCIAYHLCLRIVKLHVETFHMGIDGFELLHDSVNRDTHRAHPAAAYHYILILTDDLFELVCSLNMIQIRVKHIFFFLLSTDS